MPGPLGSSTNSPQVDAGTLALMCTPSPGTLKSGPLGPQQRVAEAMRRALPLLPAEARAQVQAMLTPESLMLIGATLTLWVGSHLFGIGEIVDVILLVTGVALLGMSVFSGAEELYSFAKTALNATTDGQLNRAAQHFARAVNILGISVISALLLRSNAKSVIARGRPAVQPMPNIGPAPLAGVPPRITRPQRLASGALGETDYWGNMAVSRNQPLTDQRLTLYHEWVHSVLSPRFGPLRSLRAKLAASGYVRSALLRYLEEALAESYAQLRVNGLSQLILGIRFPTAHGYVTLSAMAAEGTAIGSVAFGTAQFNVYLSEGEWDSGTP